MERMRMIQNQSADNKGNALIKCDMITWLIPEQYLWDSHNHTYSGTYLMMIIKKIIKKTKNKSVAQLRHNPWISTSNTPTIANIIRSQGVNKDEI